MLHCVAIVAGIRGIKRERVTVWGIGLKKLRLLDSLILTGVLYDGGVGGGSPRLTNYLRVSTNYLRPAAGRKILGLI